MENKTKLNKRLADTVLEGLKYTGLSRETLHLIHEWLLDKDKEEKKELFLRELFDDTFHFKRRPGKIAYDMLPKILEQIGIDDMPVVKRPLRYRVSFRVAAVIAPLLLLAGAAFLLIDRTTEHGDPAIYATVTAADTTKNIILPCGTEIALRPGSELTYDQNGYHKERNVTLSGEAFFSVRATGTPFIVRTEELTVRVLGTEFYVRSASGDHTAEVSLVSGSVEVQSSGGIATLQPRERLTHDKITGHSEITGFDPVQAGEWRTEALRLYGVPLTDALYRIAGFYGLELVMEGTPERQIDVNLDLKAGTTVEEVLDMLLFISDSFAYEITEETIYIR